MTRKLALRLVAVSIGVVSFLSLGSGVNAQSRDECDRFARDFARRESRRGGGALRGAVRGGVRAGVAGNIVGRRSFGRDAAKVGAIAGALSGGSRRTRNRNDLYNIAFEDCMRGTVTPY